MRALVVGGCLKLERSSSDSDCNGDSSIHVRTKVAKQDVCFHGDQQTLIFLKGLLGFLRCSVIGSFRGCRKVTWGILLTLLVLEPWGQDVCGSLHPTWSHFRHKQPASNLQLVSVHYASLLMLGGTNRNRGTWTPPQNQDGDTGIHGCGVDPVSSLYNVYMQQNTRSEWSP